MHDLKIGLRMFILMSVLTGLIYPLSMTGAAQLFFPEKAAGSLLQKEQGPIGSELLAQNFRNPIYFWPRPSAVDYKTLAAGGSNYSPSDERLLKRIQELREALLLQSETPAEPPAELLLASGSGLDPEISPEGASFQAARVAKARGLQVRIVEQLITTLSQGRQYGILGQPRVNVLKLNMALDELARKAH